MDILMARSDKRERFSIEDGEERITLLIIFTISKDQSIKISTLCFAFIGRDRFISRPTFAGGRFGIFGYTWTF